MTLEQENLVTENHNLIYHFIHKYNLPIDEYYGDCALALCRAALKYESNRQSSFATFASVCIERAIFHIFRDNKRHDVGPILSLDALITPENSSNPESFSDQLTTGLSAYDELLPYELSDILNPLEYTMSHMAASGYTQREIGSILNCSQAQVSRTLANVHYKLNKGGI